MEENIQGQRAMDCPVMVCELVLAQRMLPKWLQALTKRSASSGWAARDSYDVMHRSKVDCCSTNAPMHGADEHRNKVTETEATHQ